MKVAAYIIASVDDGPWAAVPLDFDTNDLVMRFAFDLDGAICNYDTADPDFRAHVERMYGAIAAHALRHVPSPGD